MMTPDTPEKKTDHTKKTVTFSGPIRIQSPRGGNTVSTSFTASGTYDTGAGGTSVVCQLYQAGTMTTVGGPVTAALNAARGIWTAAFTVATAGNYDVKATLMGASGPPSVKSDGVKVQTAPALTVFAPTPGQDIGGTTVNVTVRFAVGHTLQTLKIHLQDGDGNNESYMSTPVSIVRVRQWGPDPYVGLPGDYHQVYVVGDEGMASEIKVHVGALKLS